MTFASVYEILTPLSTVRKTKSWYWFDGNALKSIWGVRLGGTGSQAMADAVGDGWLSQTGTTNNSVVILHQDDKRHYDPNGSVCICIMKTNQTTDFRGETGFADLQGGGAQDIALVGIRTEGGSTTDYMIFTVRGAGSSATTASFLLDTVFHTHSLELDGTDAKYSIDGGLEATKTTDLPANKMQILSQTNNRSAVNRTKNIRYIEAYNT